MIWRFTYNGFHGYVNCAIRVPDGSKAGDFIRVSERTARRLEKLVCGIGDCLCGEGVACDVDGCDEWQVELPPMDGEIRGCYPQGN